MTAERSWFHHAIALLMIAAIIGGVLLTVAPSAKTGSAMSNAGGLTSQTSGGASLDHPFGEPSAPLVERHVYDLANALSPEEITTVEADARRLQRFGLPVLVITAISDMSQDDAARVAGAVRQDWGIATEEGANDGLVFLVVLPTGEEGQAFATLSWGDRALPHEGITVADAALIHQQWIDTRLADKPRVFDAITYGLRRLIYHAIYDPAPAAPLSGAQEAAQVILNWSAPLLVIGYVFSLMVTRVRPATLLPASRSGWRPELISFAIVLLLGAASVWSHSTIGIVCTGILLIGTLASWVRRDPGIPDRPTRASSITSPAPAGRGA